MARYLQRLRHARRHQEIARCAALRSTNFGRVRGRVFTLFDVMWSAAQLLSLAVGAALVDVIGIRPVYWMGGSLLVVADVIGSALLGRYDFRGDD